MFSTFKDLLTRHKILIAHFLAENYTEVGAAGRPPPASRACVFPSAGPSWNWSGRSCGTRAGAPPAKRTDIVSGHPSCPPCRQFFKLYTELLRSDNYVTRRQSLKLLGELLLDRSNVKIMMQARGGGAARLLGSPQAHEAHEGTALELQRRSSCVHSRAPAARISLFVVGSAVCHAAAAYALGACPTGLRLGAAAASSHPCPCLPATRPCSMLPTWTTCA